MNTVEENPSVYLCTVLLYCSVLSALSAQYQANPFMQQWFSSHASAVGYLLNGYLAAMLIGVSVSGAVLFAVDYVRSRRNVVKR